MVFEVRPEIATGQDIDLTITLLEADGATAFGTKRWDDLTVGVEGTASKLGVWGSSSSKRPMLVVGLTKEQVDRTEQGPLSLKIVMDIQDDQDEE